MELTVAHLEVASPSNIRAIKINCDGGGGGGRALTVTCEIALLCRIDSTQNRKASNVAWILILVSSRLRWHKKETESKLC